MKAIPLPKITLSHDVKAKQSEATEQMQRLLKRVAKGEMHRTLSVKDRKLLKSEGFAPDLVNNLVFKTMRMPSSDNKGYQDHLVIGFTDAAIDPSIFRCDLFTSAIKEASQGCCAFCQSELASTSSGQLYHFKPAAIIEVNGQVFRSPYLDLAYQPENLHYACRGCTEEGKQAQFPTLSKPQGDNLNAPLLLNPYEDEPAEFIGFNPLNGQAYPLDLLTSYFVETKNVEAEKVKKHLLNNPELIPNLVDFFSNRPMNQLTSEFVQWCKTINPYEYKGFQTIELFRLNRSQIVARRWERLQMVFNTKSKTYLGSEFSACVLDAINSWQATKKNAKYNWSETYKTPIKADESTQVTLIPEWLKSRLAYFVRESELDVKDKRRLIYLGEDDFLYGANNPEKSVFMPIDWLKDINNPVTIRSKQGQWQTNFTELAASHSLEIYKLFSENELLVEGDYQPAQHT